MSAPARLLFPALVALAAACGKESSAPPGQLTRDQLNGIWACARADVFYAGTGGVDESERWRTGTCGQYIGLTSPTREFEMDTTSFTISSDDRIKRRREFPPGDVSYDPISGTLMATYATADTAVYDVSSDGLRQRFRPADYTGDGRVDSVELSFVRVQ